MTHRTAIAIAAVIALALLSCGPNGSDKSENNGTTPHQYADNGTSNNDSADSDSSQSQNNGSSDDENNDDSANNNSDSDNGANNDDDDSSRDGSSDSSQTHFDNENDAQQHCPSDVVVWVNSKSGIYHMPGERWYGNTEEGYYICQADAEAEGDRETLNGQ